ncbi:MAG: Gldg family protein [Verrucomicrobiia bacterium]
MMKPACPNTAPAVPSPDLQSGGARLPILVLVFFLLGAALTGAWFKYGSHATAARLVGQELSGSTLDLLHHLNSPVEIRFYSVLPPGSAPEPLQAFSGRVDHLLSEFQSANDAKITVTRNVSTAGSNADAASADGIHPFNLDKGDACFLGLAVVCGAQKESLPQLQPEWEPALEYDLARAILHVTASPATAVVKPSAPVSPEVTNAVVRLIPDPQGTSLEDGTRILSEAAMKEFTDTGAEMEKQLQAAQQQLASAQSGQSAADQQAAMKHLQEVQWQQGENYKQIAARLQAELAVFQQLKAVAPATK